MDEQAWLASSKPRALLAHMARLHARLKRPVSEHKLRFFAYHLCRLAWATMRDERSRSGVDLAERALVGWVTDDHLALAVQHAKLACDEAYAAADGPYDHERYNAAQGAAIAIRTLIHGHTQSSIAKVRDALFFQGSIAGKADAQLLFARMADALRDIFGNPFRPVVLDPAWLTSDVLALARGIYDDRAFDRMPILADALQDAGCANEDALNHCRDASLAHVRGCWVLDLVMGQE